MPGKNPSIFWEVENTTTIEACASWCIETISCFYQADLQYFLGFNIDPEKSKEYPMCFCWYDDQAKNIGNMGNGAADLPDVLGPIVGNPLQWKSVIRCRSNDKRDLI